MTNVSTASPLPTRQNLYLFQQQPLKVSRTPLTPDVILLQAADGTKYVLKDFASRPWLMRIAWCRFAVSRETAAYRALEQVPGIPRLINVISKDVFVMEWLDGEPLPRRKLKEILGEHFFDNLCTMLDEMHKRGVAHGDLRRRNILVGADKSPRILDFETAVLRGRGIRRRLFEAIARIDRITVIKIKAKYFHDQISPQEEVLLRDLPWHLRVGRFLRQRVYGGLSPKQAYRRKKKALRQARREGGLK